MKLLPAGSAARKCRDGATEPRSQGEFNNQAEKPCSSLRKQQAGHKSGSQGLRPGERGTAPASCSAAVYSSVYSSAGQDAGDGGETGCRPARQENADTRGGQEQSHLRNIQSGSILIDETRSK